MLNCSVLQFRNFLSPSLKWRHKSEMKTVPVFVTGRSDFFCPVPNSRLSTGCYHIQIAAAPRPDSDIAPNLSDVQLAPRMSDPIRPEKGKGFSHLSDSQADMSDVICIDLKFSETIWRTGYPPEIARCPTLNSLGLQQTL